MPPRPDGRSPVEATGTAVDFERDEARRQLGELHAMCAQFEARPSCDGCGRDESVCSERLLDSITELLKFLTEHFEAEERHMKHAQFASDHRALFARHVEDHADMAETLSHIIAGLRTAPPARSARRLHGLLDHWLRRHLPEHDMLLARALRDGRY